MCAVADELSTFGVLKRKKEAGVFMGSEFNNEVDRMVKGNVECGSKHPWGRLSSLPVPAAFQPPFGTPGWKAR